MKILASCAALLFSLSLTCHGQPPAAPVKPTEDSMALIHGGTFQMGIDADDIPRFQKIFAIENAKLFQDELRLHSVTVKDFYLDQNLVTNSDFRRFVAGNPKWDLGGQPSQSAREDHYLIHWSTPSAASAQPDHPVVNVTWNAAQAYCEWQGKRLPTEAEWEFAARSGHDVLFPWGDEPPDETRANFDNNVGATTPVAAYPANPYGLFDMAGNVWQFLADQWAPYPDTSDKPKPSGSSEESSSRHVTSLPEPRRVIRGGSFAGHPVNLWVRYRDSHAPNNPREYVGFRCAKSAPTQPNSQPN
jgi:formylglycine-generating enzyme required for sulfatase activity